MDRLIGETDPPTRTTVYIYNTFSLQVGALDAVGRTTNFSYDGDGQWVREIAGGVTTHFRNYYE